MGPHPASLAEDAWNASLVRLLASRGRVPVVLPYVGYGNGTMLRVLARVVMSRPGEQDDAALPARAALSGIPAARRAAHEVHSAPEMARRGWRNFLSAEVARAAVVVHVGDARHEVVADRSGLVDVRIPDPGLEPGWHEVVLESVRSRVRTTAAVQVIDPAETFGIVSDLDDTVIRTLLPRPLLAAYNTFVLTEGARRPVPGMSRLYHDLLREHPGAPTVYLSTGAWNTIGAIGRFLARHDFPAGPLLMTAWGPTNTAWFRSGQEHKRACLRALAADLPGIRWVLVGDDGQHDPSLYGEFAMTHPEHVRAIALRQLSATEQVLAHGTATERLGEEPGPSPGVPEVRHPDGYGLLRELTEVGVLG